MYFHARHLVEFAAEHPGRYAMGDRAGITGLLLGQPLLQLEGLVADRRMIDHIRQERRLDSILADYDVDYLIVSVYAPLEKHEGAYHVSIPDRAQSGSWSRRMRGTFAVDPVDTFRGGDCITYVFPISRRATPERSFPARYLSSRSDL